MTAFYFIHLGAAVHIHILYLSISYPYTYILDPVRLHQEGEWIEMGVPGLWDVSHLLLMDTARETY